MWLAITEEDISCRECFHVIPEGNPCLSQLPVDMAQGFQRGKFDNFCINCLKCKDKTERSCYARGLSHWSTLKQTLDRPVPCAACSSTIPKGTQVVAQKFYVWPEFEPIPDNVNSASTRRNGPFASGAAATVTGTSRQGILGGTQLSDEKEVQNGWLGWIQRVTLRSHGKTTLRAHTQRGQQFRRRCRQ